MDPHKLCSVLMVPFFVGQSPANATLCHPELVPVSGTMCSARQKERCQVQIAHSTQVKFISPTLPPSGKPLTSTCPTPQAQGLGGGGGNVMLNFPIDQHLTENVSSSLKKKRKMKRKK